MKNLKETLLAMARNAVRLNIGPKGGGTEAGRFGGAPDVPPDFVWPYFETATFYDDTVKPRPLTFLAQFDCAALAPLDADGLLPHEGILSFFYETDSQPWGYDPKDAGCARVFWFPDRTALAPAAFPADMEEYFRFPSLPIRGCQAVEYPSYEEFPLSFLKACPETSAGRKIWDVFDEARNALPGYAEQPQPCHRLLGWPVIIQDCMTRQCELVSRGYYLGSGWKSIPEAEQKEAEETAWREWLLLFQLDSGVTAENFDLMFGDCGSIYFYIRKEDLAARRFDRVWLIQQCC